VGIWLIHDNGLLSLIKYWDVFDYLADCLLVMKCMAGQRHLQRLHYVTLRTRQETIVQSWASWAPKMEANYCTKM
jgi:hypothetical protein